MRRPGYLFGCGSEILKPKHFGDTIRPLGIRTRDAINFLDDDSPLPPEMETGYIPDYLRYSSNFPNHVRGWNPRPMTPGVPSIDALPYFSRPFVQPRDPRTFNTLMI